MINRKPQTQQSIKTGIQAPQQQTTTFMNAFDLYIESIKLQHKGYFFILWKRGKKSIQTLKHQSQGKNYNTIIKQTLTLNITLNWRNGRPIEKSTILSILNASEQQIDQVTIPIHKWQAQYSSLQIPIGKGVLKAKVRKRQLMQIRMPFNASNSYNYKMTSTFPHNVSHNMNTGMNNTSTFQHVSSNHQNQFNSDEQQYSQLLEQQINVVRMMMSDTKTSINRVHIDSQKDQSAKLRKQLQDTLYVNNKLKNDRSVLLTRNLQIETQLSLLKNQVRLQIQGLQKYYKEKLQVRQAIYEDQINSMVLAFNANSQYNMEMLKRLLSDNSINEKQRQKLKKEVHSLNKQLQNYQQRITQIEKQKQELGTGLSLYKQKHSQQHLEYTSKLQHLQQQLVHKTTKLSQQQKIIQQLQFDKTEYALKNKSTQEELQSCMKLISSLQQEVQQLRNNFEESKNELQFTEQAYKKEKQGSLSVEETYRNNVRKLQTIIAELQLKQTQYLQEHERHRKQNQNLRKQIMRLRGQVEVNTEKIAKLHKQTQQKQLKLVSDISELQKQLQIKQNEIKQMHKNIQIQKRSEQQAPQQSLNQVIKSLELQISSLKQQIQKLTQQLKHEFERSQKYQQQLQFINEHAIKVEEHDKLQNKVQQLEAKLADYELHFQNIQYPSFQKQNFKQLENNEYGDKILKDDHKNSMNDSKHGLNKSDEIQNVSFENKLNNNTSLISKVKNLQQQLNKSVMKIEQLVYENQDLKIRLNLLNQQVQNYHVRQRQLTNQLEAALQAQVTNTKVIQYCQSQDEQRKLQMQQIQANKSIKSKPLSRLGSRHDEQANQKQNNYKSGKIKTQHSLTPQRQKEDDKRPKNKIKKSYTMTEVLAGSAKFSKSSKVPNLSQQQLAQVVEEHDKKKDEKQGYSFKRIPEFTNKNSMKHKTQRSSSNQNMEIFQQDDEMVQHDKDKNKQKGSLLKKKSTLGKGLRKSEITMQVPELNRQNRAQSNTSNKTDRSGSQINEQVGDSKSRQSYISGSTFYKYQRVTHKQKIKRLQQQVKEYQEHTRKFKQRQQQLLVKIEDETKKLLQLEHELKNLQQDRHSLKASLHFELEKKNIPKQNKIIQTQQKSTSNQSTEANIVLEDPLKTHLQQEHKKLNRLVNDLENQLLRKSGEYQIKQKSFLIKIQQIQRKGDQLIKKSHEKSEQIQKLKKELKNVQERQAESKVGAHNLKLQKSQLVFNIQKYESQNKRYKSRVEQMQEKLKKNDVLDAFRQAQFELQNANKKILQMNRQIYQMKLQKENADDEQKLLRKKNSEIVKKHTQLQYSIQTLQKISQQAKRKETRTKRQVEEKQDAIQKLRDQNKKLMDQISSLKNISNQYIFEKKKYMDQVTALHNTIERKQYELLNLRKQIEKLRLKIQQKQDERAQNKNILRKHIQNIQSQLSQRNKQIYDLQSTIKQLTNKLQFLNSQNKRNVNQKSLLYSDKLKVYVEEITQIKKLLDDNTIENSALKQQIRQLNEQIQNTRVQAIKLQQKFAQQMSANKQLIEMLQNQHNLHEKSKFKVQQLQNQLGVAKNMMKSMKQQLDLQKKDSMQKRQLAQNLTKTNQGLIQQINRNKIKISDYQTNLQINRNFTQKLNECDKQLKSALRELRETKKQYEDYRNKYGYTASELQTNVKGVQTKWRQKYEQMKEKLEGQNQLNLNANKKHLQSQIVQLLSQISQLRTESQKKTELISELQFKITKLQVLPMKVSQIQRLYNQKLLQISKYKTVLQDNNQLKHKLTRTQQTVQQKQKHGNQLMKELLQMRSKQGSMEHALAEIQSEYKKIQKQNKMYLKQLQEAESSQKILKKEIQKLLGLNKLLQDQKIGLLNKMEDNRKQYNGKIQRLQLKLEDMSSTVKQHQLALTQHYQKSLQDIKQQLEKMYYEMQNKDKIIQQNQQIINKLDYQVQSCKKEIMSLKEKEANETEIFQIEYNKLRNKINQNQKIYRSNLENLENELQEMSKQLTNYKMKSMSQSGGLAAKDQNNASITINIMRLQDKIKQKDTKLQQLKQNIFILQQTLAKYKKKEQIFIQLTQKLTKIQKQNQDFLNQIKKLKEQNRRLMASESNASQSLKQQLHGLKQINEKLKLSLQDKQMQMDSMRYQLKGLKDLYNELQKQLDKRKNLFKQKVQNQSQHQQQMQKKAQQISELELNIQDLKARQRSAGQQLNKKIQIILSLQQKCASYEKSQNRLKISSKLSSQHQHYKSEIKRLSEQNDALAKSNKRLKQQMNNLQKENYETRTKLSLNQSSLDSLNSTLQQMSVRCKQFEYNSKKYQDANDTCYKLFHIGIQQAIFDGGLSIRIQEKDRELALLIQEVQELKFLNQRKLLDYDQLKKQNYEMQLRLDDAEFAQNQVEELREICDKLQQEKKDAVFRQQTLKLQFQSLLANSSNQARQRIQRIKLQDILRKTNNINNTYINRMPFS